MGPSDGGQQHARSTRVNGWRLNSLNCQRKSNKDLARSPVESSIESPAITAVVARATLAATAAGAVAKPSHVLSDHALVVQTVSGAPHGLDMPWPCRIGFELPP